MARWMLATGWLGLAAGCGDQAYGPCNGQNAEAEGEVDTTGDVPVFDWAYGTAYALSVYEGAGDDLGRLMWHVQCGGDNLEDNERLEEQVCIQTPIAYGEPVDSPHLDTVNLTGPKPLTPGASYVLWLNTVIEEDPPMPERESPAWVEFLAGEPGPERDDPHCGSAFSAEVAFVAPDPG